MQTLTLDRRQGKTTALLNDLRSYLDQDQANCAVVIIPAQNHTRRIHERLFELNINRNRVVVTTPEQGRITLRGTRWPVWADNLDLWEEGIYDEVFYGLEVKMITATPMGKIHLPEPKLTSLPTKRQVEEHIFRSYMAGDIDAGSMLHMMRLLRESSLQDE